MLTVCVTKLIQKLFLIKQRGDSEANGIFKRERKTTTLLLKTTLSKARLPAPKLR